MAEEKKKEEKENKRLSFDTLKDDLKKIKDNEGLSISEKSKRTFKRINQFFKDFEDSVEEDDREKEVPVFKKKMFRKLWKDDKDSLKAYIGNPAKEFLLIDEKYNQNVEPAYFWVLGFLRDDLKITDIEKIVDTYSASEASAFAKSMGQSLGAIQDRVTGHLRNIGQLVKELFQMVREIRILDEKLSLYEDGEKAGNTPENSAEITLKGQYIDLVEGGATSPSSVYSLATKVGFTLLPDLFFRIHVFDPDKVGQVIEGSEKQKGIAFNEKVKEVLKRKLRAYAGWRKTTYTTLKHRKSFMVKYLRQHYNAIMLNVEWVKPYLKTAQRLAQAPGSEAKADILVAIEQAFMEIEILAKIKKFGNFNAVTDVKFTFRTNPEMMYDSQMHQYKPSHTGRVDMKFISRAMTNDQILAYKTSIEQEDFELISSISDSIKAATKELGEDLTKYLEEAGEKFEKEPPKLKEDKNIEVAEPFIEIFRGFKEIGKSFGVSAPKFKKEEAFSVWQDEKDKKDATALATDRTFKTFWIYKKSHQMVTW